MGLKRTGDERVNSEASDFSGKLGWRRKTQEQGQQHVYFKRTHGFNAEYRINTTFIFLNKTVNSDILVLRINTSIGNFFDL